VRYGPKTRRVLMVDVLNFSARVREVFGQTIDLYGADGSSASRSPARFIITGEGRRQLTS
jgi:hypothetical protein